MSIRQGLSVVAVACLAGCGLTQSDEERINSALPPAASVSAQITALQKAADQAGARKQVDAEIAAQLKIRALNCANGYSPGRLTSAEKIREALPDLDCFRRADTSLLERLGQRYAGLVLSKPALGPKPTALPSHLAADGSIRALSFASSSATLAWVIDQGVRVRNVDKDLGLQPVPVKRGYESYVQLSPNGRILVMPGEAENSLKLVEVESGQTLATIDKVRLGSFSWAAPSMACYTSSQEGEGMLVDFAHARSIRLDALATAPNRCVPVPGTTDQFVAFGPRSTARLQVHPDEAPPRIELSKEAVVDELSYRAGRQFSVSSSGRWVAEVGTQLSWTDLTTLERKAVDLGPMAVHRMMPLPGADAFVLTGGLRHEQGLRHWVWSIADGSIAAVKSGDVGTDHLEFIPSMNKLALIDGQRMTFADGLPTEAAVPLADFLADATMQANEAKIRRAMAQPDGLLASQWAQAKAASGMPTSPAAPPAAAPAVPQAAMLGPLPANVRVDGIGIYGTDRSARPAGAQAGAKPRVAVRVRAGGVPLVLVLSSYEAVSWDLKLDPGARLLAVLVSGYEASEVQGAGSARVARMGDVYAYKMSQPEFAKLNNAVTTWTGGKALASFQGSYYGASFEAGGQ